MLMLFKRVAQAAAVQNYDKAPSYRFSFLMLTASQTCHGKALVWANRPAVSILQDLAMRSVLESSGSMGHIKAGNAGTCATDVHTKWVQHFQEVPCTPSIDLKLQST